MPAIEAVWLRGYENTLVRQTEAELIAQGAALSAAAAALWPGAATGAAPAGSAPADADYYRPEATTVDLNTSPVLAERPLPRPPRTPPDPAAIAAARLMAPVFEQTTRTTLASIVMLDRHGVVVHGPGLGGDDSALPEVAQALAGRSQTVLRRNGAYHPRYRLEWLSRASALRLHYARPILAGGQVAGVLLLSRSPRSLFRGAYGDLGKMALGAAMIIVLLIGLAGLVSRGVTRPIEALSAATRAVAAGRGEVPETPPTAAMEIRDLYEDFRRMAEVIARRSRYLRDFAASVSHEFKTPLAGIGGAVELLQDHYETMSAEERGVFLSNIAADGARLSHLVARLLDLARADMARPEADAVADLAASARRIAATFAERGFKAAVEAPPGLPLAAVSEAAIEAVLSTLLENSLQAGAGGAAVKAEAATSGSVRLTVADDGPGVPPADRDRLFEPFFTTRRATGGTGLGLSIARSLIEAHGGRLTIVETRAGATFEVMLPASPAP
ncbi:MAG: HAMP domain-containing histidine kinase [Caulobacteraceae bacterium]|nr:HAMP domain-containing histidine kinase [Caulobacteraceae bacterium]